MVGAVVTPGSAFDIQGTVLDGDSNAVSGAVVRLIGRAAVDTTDSVGAFQLTEASAARQIPQAARSSGISVRRDGARLFFTVDHEKALSVDVFTLAGKYLVGRKLNPSGAVTVLPFEYAKSPLLIRVDDGVRTLLFKASGIDGAVAGGKRTSVVGTVGTSAMAAGSSYSDELVIEHSDFDPFSTPVSDSVGTLSLNIGFPYWKCEGEETGKAFQVLWPNGGETLFVGDTVLLKFCAWYPDEDDITKVPPAITTDGGVSWSNLEVTNVGNRVYWVVQDSIYSVKEDKNIYLPSDACFIRISEYGNPFGHDNSDGTFVIRER